MEPILFVVLLTAATGVGGLALGGALAALFKRESPQGASLLLSFTAGLMLSIVALDMVPEAMEAIEGGVPLLLVPGLLVLGFVVTYLLNCWIDKSAHHEDHDHPTTAPAATTTCTPRASCWRRRWRCTMCRWAWRWGPRWRCRASAWPA